MSWCYGNMGGMTTGMWIFGLLWVGIASAAVVAVYLAIARRQPHSLPTDAALVTLPQRYARGEIDVAQQNNAPRPSAPNASLFSPWGLPTLSIAPSGRIKATGE